VHVGTLLRGDGLAVEIRDEESGITHVQSEHFNAARQTLPPYLSETPRIVNTTFPQDDWYLLGEMAVQK
jgi:hypothetical protein